MDSDSRTIEQLHNMTTQVNEKLQQQQQQQGLQTKQGIHPGIGASTVKKKNKPPAYDGKAPVDVWVSHMNAYLCGTPAHDSLSIAVSYITDQAHKWYLEYT